MQISLQELTGLNQISIGTNGVVKEHFKSAIEGIWIEEQQIFILEPSGGAILNRYLDCSFYFLLKQMGYPTKRKIPYWAGTKWEKAKYIP